MPPPAMTAIELQHLVERAQGGDREAFGQIYEQLARQIFGYIYHRVGRSSDLAEELTAGVFLKVIENLDRYQDRGLPFVSWVYRLAHNHLVDYFRRELKQAHSPIEDGNHVVELGAERALSAALTKRELTSALCTLTADQQTVITLRFLRDLNIAETAAQMGKSEDAIKKLQARGLAALRRALTGHGATRADFAA
jgi:RNA polymerase sigma-70 factor (ECF subfamily)